MSARPTWIFLMKIGDRISGIFQCICRARSAIRCIVAHPIHQILQFAAPKFGIQDRLYLELRDTIHLYGWSGRHDSSRESVGDMWFEETHTKIWVDFNGGRQPQAISLGADLANDRIGTESTNI